MDIKEQLQLNLPINFYNVCTLYPLTVIDAIEMSNDILNNIFIPYMVTKEIIDEKFQGMDLYEILIMDSQFFKNIVDSLVFFCRTENINYNVNTKEFIINNNQETLNKNNFDEFSQIILDIGRREKITKQLNMIPKFETDEGYKRWKKLQEMREKNKLREKPLTITKVINYVQFGGDYYISDDEIKKWTYWKLFTAYDTISNIIRYNHSFKIYLQTGEKKLIEKHWSELINL